MKKTYKIYKLQESSIFRNLIPVHDEKSFDTNQDAINFINENPDDFCKECEYTILPIITKL